MKTRRAFGIVCGVLVCGLSSLAAQAGQNFSCMSGGCTSQAQRPDRPAEPELDDSMPPFTIAHRLVKSVRTPTKDLPFDSTTQALAEELISCGLKVDGQLCLDSAFYVVPAGVFRRGNTHRFVNFLKVAQRDSLLAAQTLYIAVESHRVGPEQENYHVERVSVFKGPNVKALSKVAEAFKAAKNTVLEVTLPEVDLDFAASGLLNATNFRQVYHFSRAILESKPSETGSPETHRRMILLAKEAVAQTALQFEKIDSLPYLTAIHKLNEACQSAEAATPATLESLIKA